MNGNINRSNYWIFCGNNDCNKLLYNHYKLSELVAKSIYYDFPDSFDRRLSIGDCCPSVGDCNGHPKGSHSFIGTSFDMNYYTINDFNTTQYRPKTSEDIGKKVNIWNKLGVDLIEEKFDWERNFIFMYRMKQIFRDFKPFLNDVIYNFMSKKIENKYGRDKMLDFWKMSSQNAGTEFNHHTHSHLNLGSKINRDFNIKDFIKRKI